MRKLIMTFIVAMLMVSFPVYGEIEKVGDANNGGEICLYWWPKLPEIKGWHQELDAGYEYRANILAPDGSNFRDAETVIYALALYKPRMPETKSLQILIDDDKEKFISDNIIVSEVDPLKTADGRILRSFTFIPKDEGNWERVSYGEEDDYFIVFTVSSRTQEGLESASDIYKQIITQYE